MATPVALVLDSLLSSSDATSGSEVFSSHKSRLTDDDFPYTASSFLELNSSPKMSIKSYITGEEMRIRAVEFPDEL